MRSQWRTAMITAALLAAGCSQERGSNAPPPTADAQQAASNALAFTN
jgi:hypothetical protein